MADPLPAASTPPPSLAELSAESMADFFDAGLAAFAEAARCAGEELVQRYRVAGRSVRLHFAGGALARRLAPPLSHLSDELSATLPSLEVYLWDTASTGVSMPDTLWCRKEGKAISRIYGDHRFHVSFAAELELLCMIDFATGRAIYRLPDAGLLPGYECAAPLRGILYRWLARQGMQMIHAGAVSVGGRAVVLTGRGGSGKSTAAMACLALGDAFSYLGDDYCLCEFTDDAATVHSLYNSVKLCADSAARFPGFRYEFRSDRPEPKAIGYLASSHPGRMASRARLEALLVPTVTGRAETVLRPAGPAELLRAMAPSSLLLFHDTSQQALSRMAELARRLPCYRLELGTELRGIAGAVSTLLEAP